jgi:hypothetical protein
MFNWKNEFLQDQKYIDWTMWMLEYYYLGMFKLNVAIEGLAAPVHELLPFTSFWIHYLLITSFGAM